MCGIAGYVGGDARSMAGKIEKMLDIQAHRGPDARGSAYFDQCALGHLRLSIIDLSQAANQPFVSHDGRYTLTYNGEIYNYKELRSQLEGSGYRFATKSDTEVVLVAWQEWGKGCLDRFIGMYAFGIWDEQEKKLFCARDRFGIKPFNYYQKDGVFWFASEIKGLLAAGIEREADRQTWATYLTMAHYDHTADTFFSGVKRLLPGHYLELEPGKKPTITRYWFPPEPFSMVDPGFEYEDACARLRSLLLNSVELHLRADVPCGLLISGGVDSAVVLSGSQQAGFKNILGFHHYFPEPYSEMPWVEELVRIYHAPMHYYELRPSLVEESFDYYAWHLEEPFGSLVMLALGPLYAKARQHGVRVFLDGNGADDIFGGYRQHQMAFLADLIRTGQKDLYRRSLLDACEHWQQKESVITGQVDLLFEDSKLHRSIDMTLPVVEKAIDPSLKKLPPLEAPSIQYDSILATYMIKGLTQTKIPRNMRFDDHLSMSFSNEQRVPLLDHRLSEFVATIPPQFLFQRGLCKSIVRDSMTGLIPDKVRYARKREVQSPQREWLGKPLQKFVEKILNSKSFSERGFIDAESARDYYQGYLQKTPANSFALWQWINMEVWHRRFIDASLDEIQQRPVLLPDEQGFRVNRH